jgi:hypothetical protein
MTIRAVSALNVLEYSFPLTLTKTRHPWVVSTIPVVDDFIFPEETVEEGFNGYMCAGPLELQDGFEFLQHGASPLVLGSR